MTIRLAVVDDHALVAEGFAALLAAQAPDFEVVYVGDDPTQVYDRALDVVVLDVDLGPARPPAAEIVEKLLVRGIPCLLVSALTSGRLIRRAVLSGAAGYLPKSTDATELVAAVRTIAGGEFFLTRQMAAVLADTPVALSDRERQSVGLYAQGLPVKSVARRMDVADHTVREYLRRAKRKVEASGQRIDSRVDWIAVAEDQGLDR